MSANATTTVASRVDWAIEHGPQRASMAFLLLMLLVRQSNSQGICAPQISQLADATGYSTRHVSNQLQRLAAAGYLERVRIQARGRQERWLCRLMIPGAGPVTALPDNIQLLAMPPGWDQPVPDSHQPDNTLTDMAEPAPANTATQPALAVTVAPTTQKTSPQPPPAPQGGAKRPRDTEVTPKPENGSRGLSGASVATAEVVDIERLDRYDPHTSTNHDPERHTTAPPILTIDPNDPDLAQLAQSSPTKAGHQPHRNDLDTSQRLRDELAAVVSATGDPKRVAGVILGYYLVWREENQLPHPPTTFIPQIRRSIRILLEDRGLSPTDALHAVLEWHDWNANAYARGWSIARPGKIITLGERLATAGTRHGTNGAGLTAKQQNYKKATEDLAALSRYLKSQ